MQIFSLPNHVSHNITVTDAGAVSVLPSDVPAGLDKPKFREWCAKATTAGHFISGWQGVTPTVRIDAGNPAAVLHGIIADYDSTDAASHLSKLPSTTKHMPTWVIDSFTPGKIRLIWEFEKPFKVSDPEITEHFLKELDGRVGISNALPGFDKASWKASQYFEKGTNWRKMENATPIPKGVLEVSMMEGGLKAKRVFSDEPVIPMEIVAAEVERQFPGRWKNAFTEGARGPLFWINDGITREGCAVAETGMICYSDRAAGNFLRWSEVLGSKFVDKFVQEKAERAAGMFYFDGRAYWHKGRGGWEWLNKDDAKLHLKNAGCSDKKLKDKGVSEIEKVLVHIQSHRRVAGAVPVLFRLEEVVRVNGADYLNTSTRRAMQPAATGNPQDFPWIYDFITNAFDGTQNGIPANEYFIGWFKRFYKSALEGNPQPGQVVILAGEAHTGKTFFNKCILGEAMGGSTAAEALLMRKTMFNKEGAQVSVWRCDDASSDGDYRSRQQFANALKAMAANPSQMYQPKFMDAIELPFLGRVFVTCNVDPESLRILPTLDNTIKDKLMLFKLSSSFTPKFYNTNSQNEEMVLKELPHFLRWVLDYQVDSRVIDPLYKRFEIKSFHHHELVEQANLESREYVLSEYIEQWLVVARKAYKKGEIVELTATALLSAIKEANNGQDIGSIKAENLGKQLHKLLEQNMVSELLSKKMRDGRTVYAFMPVYDEDAASKFRAENAIIIK
jgi:hypothetical protein